MTTEIGERQPPDPEPTVSDKFDHWCLLAQSDVMMDGEPLPMLTVLLHRVCGSDEKKFEQAVEMMRAAFTAGHEIATADLQKPE